MHTSIKLDTPCEFINIVPLNPLISKCQIKVCYVGDEPNRNNSIITKDVARQMANSLPGSPIVGYFNESENDFEEHNRSIELSNGEFKIKDTTKPYGFVDLNAKVWFQKYLDDNAVEHEYLCTEGYLWTGQYPEAQRILTSGNNHSMELDDNLIDATWTKDDKGKPQFFIINEAIISKLCILGEDYEPCFEGSNITKVQFSFEDSFKQELYSMMKELKELLGEGGTKVSEIQNAEEVLVEEKEEVAAEEVVEEVAEEVVEAAEEVSDSESKETEFKASEDKKDEDKKDEESEDESDEDESADEKAEDEKKSEDEDKDDEDKKDKKKYTLEEIPEYVELQSKYSDLESRYNALIAEADALKQFKLNTERVQKMDMINNTFYMLSEEDKADVISNVDNYSLDDIEAKLSVICFRNKISFVEKEDEVAPTTFNLSGNELFYDDSTPEWVRVVLENEKNK